MLLNQSVSNLISAYHRKVLSLPRPFKLMGFLVHVREREHRSSSVAVE